MCGLGKKNNTVIRLLKNGMLVTITHNGGALRSGGNLENRCSDLHFYPTDAKHIVKCSAGLLIRN